MKATYTARPWSGLGDLADVTEPAISVLTPSFNLCRFLRDTVESVGEQSHRGFEHIVVDGGSSDGSLEVLASYPHLRWIAEPDDGPAHAIAKAFRMSRGRYIVQCCVSDGFLDRHWFRKCVEILDGDPETSLVWGVPQYLSETGDILDTSYADLFFDPPGDRRDFLAYWLATGFFFPEGNYCVRRDVFERCYPRLLEDDPFRNHSALGFVYNFNASGYLARFLPMVANYGRTHGDALRHAAADIEGPLQVQYFEAVRAYRRRLLAGAVAHRFLDGQSRPVGEVAQADIGRLRRQVWRERIVRSRAFNSDLHELLALVRKRLGAR